MGSEQSLKEPVKPSPKPPVAPNRSKLLRSAVIAIAVVAALVSWLATRDDGDVSSAPAPAPAESPGARIVSADELREAAATLDQPIYWAGLVAGRDIELRELGEGAVQVLYLPDGAEVDATARTLTIGSYALADPAGALETVARRRGTVIRNAADGREVVAGQPATSVYFASPDNRVQVEVYDPSPARAMSLALSGRVQPVR